MQLYGIIGYPLSHSFSPDYFNRKFAAASLDAHYEAFQLRTLEELPGLLQAQPRLCGLNVTIPYKQAVLPYLDHISTEAQLIGAVNCIRIKDGMLYGHNTDHIGFRESLRPLLDHRIYQALVFGTGGAAQAVTYALTALNIPFRSVSRHPVQEQAIAYSDVDTSLLSDYHLLINTTPLGMYPELQHCPELPYHAIGSQHILYDLIYNPAETRFLQQGRQQGARIKNGAEMLHLQAEAGWRIWNMP